MGLGKTLTVLALIAGSLDNENTTFESGQSGRGQDCNKTTLVVTPRSGKFHSTAMPERH